MSGVPQFLDVTVRLRAAMPFYPGNPEFELQPNKRIAEGESSNVSRLVVGTHTGTHFDAPRPFIDDGAATEQPALEVLSTGRAEAVKGGQECTTTHS